MTNIGAGTEPGEPAFNGRMKKTVWGRITPDEDARIVIHTFGSDFDTALAVHTGNKVNKLKTVIFNDNTKVPSLSNTASLVQFDAEKGVGYSVQIGSKTSDEGDALANVFVFPKSGGLSVYLAQLGGSPHFGREFICVIGDGHGSACGDPTFLLHNSTNNKLKIKASSDLGPGIVAPKTFTLKPGKLAIATFTFDAGFDKATIRTVAGHFSFVGKKGKKAISRADIRALIAVKAQGPSPDALEMSTSPTVQGNWINAANTFEVTLKNTASYKAKGCHARAERFTDNRVVWQRIKSKTGKAVGEPNTPIDIPKGQSRSFLVTVGSMSSRDADPTFARAADVVIDCANTAAAPFDLRNNFDFSAIGGWELATLATKILSPKGDQLKVPKDGQSSFKVSAKSNGANGTIIVRPSYIRPFDETDPDELFPVSVCLLTGKNGSCAAAPTFSVEYETKKKVTRYFKAFVDAPSKNPGYDPAIRRVFLQFHHKKPPDKVGVTEITVAAESIAPKRM